MSDQDLENIKIYLRSRKIDVRENNALRIHTEVLNLEDTLSVLEIYNKGNFYTLVKNLQSMSSDFDEIIFPNETHRVPKMPEDRIDPSYDENGRIKVLAVIFFILCILFGFIQDKTIIDSRIMIFLCFAFFLSGMCCLMIINSTHDKTPRT